MSRAQTHLRLTHGQFGSVWTMVKNDERLASVLGYSLPADRSTLECRGYSGDEVDKRRVVDFIALNRIELVESEEVQPFGHFERPRYENGRLSIPPSFAFAHLFRHVAKTGAHPARLIPAGEC